MNQCQKCKVLTKFDHQEPQWRIELHGGPPGACPIHVATDAFSYAHRMGLPGSYRALRAQDFFVHFRQYLPFITLYTFYIFGLMLIPKAQRLGQPIDPGNTWVRWYRPEKAVDRMLAQKSSHHQSSTSSGTSEVTVVPRPFASSNLGFLLTSLVLYTGVAECQTKIGRFDQIFLLLVLGGDCNIVTMVSMIHQSSSVNTLSTRPYCLPCIYHLFLKGLFYYIRRIEQCQPWNEF